MLIVGKNHVSGKSQENCNPFAYHLPSDHLLAGEIVQFSLMPSVMGVRSSYRRLKTPSVSSSTESHSIKTYHVLTA